MRLRICAQYLERKRLEEKIAVLYGGKRMHFATKDAFFQQSGVHAWIFNSNALIKTSTMKIRRKSVIHADHVDRP